MRSMRGAPVERRPSKTKLERPKLEQQLGKGLERRIRTTKLKFEKCPTLAVKGLMTKIDKFAQASLRE